MNNIHHISHTRQQQGIDTQINRLPPQDIDAEASFLSACMIDGKKEHAELLNPDDFYRTAHGKILSAIQWCHETGADPTAIAVANRLKETHKLEEIGGATYLAQLINEIPISINPENDALIIKKEATRRRIIYLCNEMSMGCFEYQDISELLGLFRTKLSKIDDGLDDGSWVRMGELVDIATEQWEANKGKGGVTGVPSGLFDVDKTLGGFQPGNLYIVAGRPGMGKSAFAFCIGKNAAMAGHPVGIISIEMGKIEVITRSTSDISGVDGERFRSGEIEDYHWHNITDALAKIEQLPIWIEDSPTANITGVQRKIRRFVKKVGSGKIPIILIDYLQYIEGVKSERKDIEIGTVTRGLKSLSKELGIPIVLLSQLSRKVEERDDKRPRRSDLRNSGEIEQDADVIAFLYRDEYYNPKTTDKAGIVEFIIDKFRAGKTGVIELAWIAHRTTFENLARY